MHENSSTNMLCFMLQKYMNASVVFSNSCMTTAVMNTMNGYEIIKYAVQIQPVFNFVKFII